MYFCRRVLYSCTQIRLLWVYKYVYMCTRKLAIRCDAVYDIVFKYNPLRWQGTLIGPDVIYEKHLSACKSIDLHSQADLF